MTQIIRCSISAIQHKKSKRLSTTTKAYKSRDKEICLPNEKKNQRNCQKKRNKNVRNYCNHLDDNLENEHLLLEMMVNENEFQK